MKGINDFRLPVLALAVLSAISAQTSAAEAVVNGDNVIITANSDGDMPDGTTEGVIISSNGTVTSGSGVTPTTARSMLFPIKSISLPHLTRIKMVM